MKIPYTSEHPSYCIRLNDNPTGAIEHLPFVNAYPTDDSIKCFYDFNDPSLNDESTIWYKDQRVRLRDITVYVITCYVSNTLPDTTIGIFQNNNKYEKWECEQFEHYFECANVWPRDGATFNSNSSISLKKKTLLGTVDG